MTTVAPFSLACSNRGSDVKVQACPLIWTDSILHLLPPIFFFAYPIPSHPLFLTTPSPHSLPAQSPLFPSFLLSPFLFCPPLLLSPLLSLPFTPFLPSLLLSPHSLPYSRPSRFLLAPSPPYNLHLHPSFSLLKLQAVIRTSTRSVLTRFLTTAPG